MLLYLILQVICGLSLSKKKNNIPTKTKVLFGIVVIITMLIMIDVTNDRNVSTTWIEKIYEYFFCCIPLLDHYLPLTNTYTFGSACLNGVLNPILFFVSRIIPITTPYETTIASNMLNIQQAVHLSNNITTNAFVTSFFYTFLDGGIAFVFIGMLLYGYWSKRKYQMATRLSL